jgi:hypothetical protein
MPSQMSAVADASDGLRRRSCVDVGYVATWALSDRLPSTTRSHKPCTIDAAVLVALAKSALHVASNAGERDINAPVCIRTSLDAFAERVHRERRQVASVVVDTALDSESLAADRVCFVIGLWAGDIRATAG